VKITFELADYRLSKLTFLLAVPTTAYEQAHKTILTMPYTAISL